MNTTPQRAFRLACGFEIALLGLGMVIARFAHLSWLADFHWSVIDALWGIGLVAPPLALFVFGLHSRWKIFKESRRVLERNVGPLFTGFSTGQLLTVSILAGLAEEVFFRAVIQGGLQELLNRPLALGIASVGFGCAHFLNRSYAVLTALAGLYLGGLWMAAGNLLTPMITHALYDFLALLYLLKRFPKTSAENRPANSTLP